jgi:hypothetical protein
VTISKRGLDGLFLVFGFVALAVAGYLFALSGSKAAADNSGVGAPALAPNMISGVVTWKGTGKPVAAARVLVSEPNSKQLVSETSTDAEGYYLLLSGVGTWLVEVPSAENYYGYSQIVTVLPHESYSLDFGVSVRQVDPPATPTSAPTMVPPTALPAATVAPTVMTPLTPQTTSATGSLPSTGMADGAWLQGLLLLAVGILSLAVGTVLRFRRLGYGGGPLTAAALGLAGAMLWLTGSRAARSNDKTRRDRS